jgi:hypothetical protein
MADVVPITTENLDPFGFARETDAELLALFRQWVEDQRACEQFARGKPDDDEDVMAMLDAIDVLVERMAVIPATGTIGLVVKTYLVGWHESGGSSEDAPAISSLLTDDNYISDRVLASLIADLPRFVPEIAPLVRRAGEMRVRRAGDTK